MNIHTKEDVRPASIKKVPPLVDTFTNTFSVITQTALSGLVLMTQAPKKITKAIDKISKGGKLVINGDEPEEEMLQKVLDTIQFPAVISQLNNAEILFINNAAKKQFAIENHHVIKMHDLYVNVEDYKSVVKAVKKHDKLEDFVVEMKSLSGEDLHVANSSNTVYYKDQKCKITCFKDVTKEKEYQHLATIDGLTGINNRLNIMARGKAEFARSRRHDHAMTTLLIDVDFFKKINDTYGHKAGDDALKELAKRVSTSLRDGDIFGRFGGEEFAIVLPETSAKEASEIAERIRKSVKDLHLYSEEENENFNITVSIGISCLCANDNNIEEILHRADVALYEAKNNGRDRITNI